MKPVLDYEPVDPTESRKVWLSKIYPAVHFLCGFALLIFVFKTMRWNQRVNFYLAVSCTLATFGILHLPKLQYSWWMRLSFPLGVLAALLATVTLSQA